MCGHRDTFAAKGQQTVKWFAGNAPVNSRNVETITGEQFKKAFPSEARAFSHDFMRLTSVQDGRLYYIGAIGSSVRPITRRVVFVETDRPTKCGAMCRNAKGPMCDCSCKGDNHGAGVTMSRARFAAEDLDLRPTAEMAANAERGLALREEHGKGGTAVGVARKAAQIDKAKSERFGMAKINYEEFRAMGYSYGQRAQQRGVRRIVDDKEYTKALSVRLSGLGIRWDDAAGVRAHKVADEAWSKGWHAAMFDEAENPPKFAVGEPVGWNIGTRIVRGSVARVNRLAKPEPEYIVDLTDTTSGRKRLNIPESSLVKMSRSSHNIATLTARRRENTDKSPVALAQIDKGTNMKNARKEGFALDDIGSRERLKESIQRHQFYTDRIRRAQAEFRVAFREDFGINADPEVIRDLNAVVDRAVADSQRNPKKAAADLRAWADGITSMWMHHDHGKRTALAARQIAMQMANLASSGFARKATPNKDRFSMTYDEAEYQIALAEERIDSRGWRNPEQVLAWTRRANAAMRRADAGDQKAQAEVIQIATTLKNLYASQHSRPGAKAKFASKIIKAQGHRFKITDEGEGFKKIYVEDDAEHGGWLFLRRVADGLDAERLIESGAEPGPVHKWVHRFSRPGAKAAFSVDSRIEVLRQKVQTYIAKGGSWQGLDKPEGLAKLVGDIINGSFRPTDTGMDNVESRLRKYQGMNFYRTGAKAAFAANNVDLWNYFARSDFIMVKQNPTELANYERFAKKALSMADFTPPARQGDGPSLHQMAKEALADIAQYKEAVYRHKNRAPWDTYGRPGASEAFALGRVSNAATPQADEALTALAAQVGREHTVSLFKRWTEGKAAMSRGDAKAAFGLERSVNIMLSDAGIPDSAFDWKNGFLLVDPDHHDRIVEVLKGYIPWELKTLPRIKKQAMGVYSRRGAKTTSATV